MVVYQAVLEIMIRYGIHLWYGNLTMQLKTKLTQLRKAIKIVGMKEHSYLRTLYEKSVLREACKIFNDNAHFESRILNVTIRKEIENSDV